ALDAEHVGGEVLRAQVSTDELVALVALVQVVVGGAVGAALALAVVRAVRVGDTHGAQHGDSSGDRHDDDLLHGSFPFSLTRLRRRGRRAPEVLRGDQRGYWD